jgi:uncharacterized membrane protein YuzA (DUF378 family)
MKGLTIASLVLMVIGAINWGLIGIFRFNLVTFLFGSSVLTPIVYILVGLAGIYGLFMLSRLSSAQDDVCVPSHARTQPVRPV